MRWWAQHKTLLAALAVGGLFGLATLDVAEFTSLGGVVFLFFPGIILAMAVSGDVHAFPLPIAALGNLLFWGMFLWVIGLLIGKIGRRTARPEEL
jgi:hypothetical protein